MKVQKNSQLASNIKIKGAPNGHSKHAHNQSVAVVSQSQAYAKINMNSIENLSGQAA